MTGGRGFRSALYGTEREFDVCVSNPGGSACLRGAPLAVIQGFRSSPSPPYHLPMGRRPGHDPLCCRLITRGLATGVFVFCGLVSLLAACSRRSTVPAALSDEEFWQLTQTLSEPAGQFTVSENLLSNEPRLSENAGWLRSAGGVYLGVGPEQNFTYIARVRPRIAFIVDIRRENRNLHLLYKALFELSSDRMDFVSRLFSRPRPSGLGTGGSANEIFDRVDRVPASRELYDSNLANVRERLVTRRRLPLSREDLDDISRIFTAFSVDGPAIRFWGSRNVDAVQPTYRELMTTVDASAEARSFLATDEAFTFVKDLQSRNLIVPIVGDFAGTSALRGIGEYSRRHADAISAFYASNVGVYLTNQQTRGFCGNLASLPTTSATWFIEREAVRPVSAKLSGCPSNR